MNRIYSLRVPSSVSLMMWSFFTDDDEGNEKGWHILFLFHFCRISIFSLLLTTFPSLSHIQRTEFISIWLSPRSYASLRLPIPGLLTFKPLSLRLMLWTTSPRPVFSILTFIVALSFSGSDFCMCSLYAFFSKFSFSQIFLSLSSFLLLPVDLQQQKLRWNMVLFLNLELV